MSISKAKSTKKNNDQKNKTNTAKIENFLSFEDFTKDLLLQSKSDSNAFFSKKYSDIIYILGDELFRIEKFLKWLKDNYTNVGFFTLNGEDLNFKKGIENLYSIIKPQDLFSDNSIVIIKQAELIKIQPCRDICAGLSKIAHGKKIIFLSQKEDSNVIKEASSFNFNYSIFKLTPFGETQKLKYLMAESKGALLYEGAQLLLKICEDNPELALNELKKLQLILDDEEQITGEFILSQLKNTYGGDIFGIINSISRKDVIKAQSSLLKELESGSHPLQINTIINKCARTALANKDKTHTANKELTNYWFLKNTTALNRVDTFGLKNILKSSSDLDIKLKSSRMTPEQVMSNEITKLYGKV